ncbi:MAG: uridine kinase [Rhodospirillaceae bacterium]|nr:uridine kinase [Rhodospirillaceae bacterium]
MSQDGVIAEVCDAILSLTPGAPAVIAIDGPDASGKTTFADALVAPLQTRGCEVIRASVDDFEQPRADRHARGRFSAKGYYRDSFDYGALQSLLLDPLRSGLSPALVRTRSFDLVADAPVSSRPLPVTARGIVIVDGVFLLRPELRDAWDLTVHLDVADEECLRRALARAGGDSEELRRLNEARYLAGHRLYRDESDPLGTADVVIDNNEPAKPVIRRFARDRSDQARS